MLDYIVLDIKLTHWRDRQLDLFVSHYGQLPYDVEGARLIQAMKASGQWLDTDEWDDEDYFEYR